MKKITALLLSVVLTMGMILAASGAPPAPTPGATLGFSAQDTVPNGGTASASISGGAIKVGDTFTVQFNVDAIKWSTTGNGTFEAGLLGTGWLQIAGAQKGVDFQVTGISVNSSNGTVTATIKAERAYSGTATFSLNGGSGASSAVALSLTVEDVWAGATKTASGGTAPSLVSPKGSSLSLKTGDTIQFLVPANNFVWNSSSGQKNAATITDTSWVKISGASQGTDFTVRYVPSTNGSGDTTVVLTALRVATYNNLSISLQGGGGSATASSAPISSVAVSNSGDGKITGIASDARLGGTWSGALLNGKPLSYSQLESLNVKSGDVILISMDAGFFTWSGNAPYSSSSVTRSQLRSGKIDLALANQRGRQAVKSGFPKLVEENGRVYIKVEFAKDAFTKGDDIDFSLRIYLTVDKSRHSGSELVLAGTLEQEVWTVSDEDYLDISDGTVIEPDEYIRNIELYLGEGVSIHARLLEGRKYAGRAYQEISSADERFLDQYPSIERVIVLKTLNLGRTGDKVSFDYNYNYYVYNEDGEYLGRSDQMVAYSRKYYLSTERIDIDIVNDLPNVPDVAPPHTDLDSMPSGPSNINDIPLTGR